MNGDAPVGVELREFAAEERGVVVTRDPEIIMDDYRDSGCCKGGDGVELCLGEIFLVEQKKLVPKLY